MTRLYGLTQFAAACAAAAIIASGYFSRKDIPEVSAAVAATIKGGQQSQCGSFQMLASGACTDAGDDSCTSVATTNCSGACPYQCSATTTYTGSGTFTGQLLSDNCDMAAQPVCTLTSCDVSGLPVPCCQCIGGSNVPCGPAPFDLDPDGCSNH
jgi:hypothetical protein